MNQIVAVTGEATATTKKKLWLSLRQPSRLYAPHPYIPTLSTEYDAIQAQKVKQPLIHGLIKVPSDTHDYGRAYLIKDEEAFQTRLGDPKEALPIAPKGPANSLAVSNPKQFRWELQMYNDHMNAQRATVNLLKELFPNSLVALEVTNGYLSPKLTAKEVYEHIEKTASNRTMVTKLLLFFTSQHTMSPILLTTLDVP